IVDHDVDAAERRVTLRDEIPGVRILAEVGGNGDDLAAGCLRDLGGGRLERLLAPGADRDVDAFLRQRPRKCPSPAPAAAGHQRGLAFELQVHVDLLVTLQRIGNHAGLCAIQRPASAAENRSASAAFTAAGSSLLMVWPARGITSSAAVGAVRLMNTLP